MPLSRTKLVGFAFVAGAIGLYGIWAIWLATRTDRPIDVPLSLAIGQIRTREFKVNLNAIYIIEIEVQKKIPFDTLNCLLGLGMSSASFGIAGVPRQTFCGEGVLDTHQRWTNRCQRLQR
jgi:hypothetical protein